MHTTVAIQIKKITTHEVASCSIPVNELIHYKIYNHSGQMVFSKSTVLINTAGKALESLEVSELPEGNYRLNISTENKSLKNISVTI